MLAPALAPHEAERKRLISQAIRQLLIAGGGGLVLGATVGLLARDIGLAWLGLAIPVAIVGFMAWGRLQRFRTSCKTEALTGLAQAIGLTYQCEGFDPDGLKRLRQLALLPGYERSHFEDRFSGRRDACDFQLYEARLDAQEGSGKNSHWVTVFGGQVVCIAFPKKFLGTTVVNREGVRALGVPGLERVNLESGDFERIFEVYGTDQVEARYLVHPVFMEKLVALENALGGAKLRCAFDAGELMVAVEGGDLFEIVDLWQPLPSKETARTGVDGISHVLKLIDAVLSTPANPFADPKPAGQPAAGA